MIVFDGSSDDINEYIVTGKTFLYYFYLYTYLYSYYMFILLSVIQRNMIVFNVHVSY